jgi:tartrate dehydratase alpha subunit/fumarate hydratase class I-like protein
MHFQDQAYTQELTVMKCAVRKALREITGNKATDADELAIELIKEAGEAAITGLTALCQQIWESTLSPQEWKRSIFLLLPKN